jgi:hypothetical protein
MNNKAMLRVGRARHGPVLGHHLRSRGTLCGHSALGWNHRAGIMESDGGILVNAPRASRPWTFSEPG